MERYRSRIQTPVKRLGAEFYLLLTLLSFAASVTLTRFLLYLTGYPQIGGGGLHIAHVLWGGLMLFIAALLPLIFANRWVYTLNALLTGIGMGLFIDEVGKFITQNNNYFFPAAAPIIYAFFLLTVLLYFQVRRPPKENARVELYRSFEAFEEVLDRDLDSRERIELTKRLEFAARQEEEPDLAHLAQDLLGYVTAGSLYVVPSRAGFLQKATEKVLDLENRYVSRMRLRAALAGGVGALSLIALSKLGETLLSGIDPTHWLNTLSTLVSLGILHNAGDLRLFLVRVVLEGSIGLLMLISAVFLALGKDRPGIWGSYWSLLLSLTTVDLLLFYFEQFSMIVTAIFQLLLLLAIIHYRQKYLPHRIRI
jgi:hypothetical protein